MPIEVFISWVIIFCGILILLKFVLIGYFYFFTITKWKTTLGKIEKSSIDYFISDLDLDTQGYKLFIVYSYCVEGIEYRNTKISRNIGLLTPDKEYQKKDLKRFITGNKVIVFYNPKKPSISLVDGKFDDFNVMLLLFAIIFILVGIYLS